MSGGSEWREGGERREGEREGGRERGREGGREGMSERGIGLEEERREGERGESRVRVVMADTHLNPTGLKSSSCKEGRGQGVTMYKSGTQLMMVERGALIRKGPFDRP